MNHWGFRWCSSLAIKVRPLQRKPELTKRQTSGITNNPLNFIKVIFERDIAELISLIIHVFPHRGLWLQPVQTTHCICGISVRGDPPSCTPSNSTESGRHCFSYLKYTHDPTHQPTLGQWSLRRRQRQTGVTGRESWYGESESELLSCQKVIGWHYNENLFKCYTLDRLTHGIFPCRGLKPSRGAPNNLPQWGRNVCIFL